MRFLSWSLRGREWRSLDSEDGVGGVVELGERISWERSYLRISQ